MEKILNLLKDNQALRTLDTDKGTIVTNSTSEEAYLIAGSFWHNPRKIYHPVHAGYRCHQEDV